MTQNNLRERSVLSCGKKIHKLAAKNIETLNDAKQGDGQNCISFLKPWLNLGIREGQGFYAVEFPFCIEPAHIDEKKSAGMLQCLVSLVRAGSIPASNLKKLSSHVWRNEFSKFKRLPFAISIVVLLVRHCVQMR